MSDAADSLVRELYASRVYPPMSHPSADPALLAVAARLGGLEVVRPETARILEIGCAGGHHLISLARRWPGSKCQGIDLGAEAVAEAQRRAAASGTGNATFEAVDLREFVPVAGGYDFIIAHGFLSWVPGAVQDALFEFCRRHLAPAGVAVISYNVLPGWEARLEVVRRVLVVQRAHGGEVTEVLERLRPVVDDISQEAVALRLVIDDMLAKGEEILPFDDFAPVNDPWSFERFFRTATVAGLHYLGEADPAENRPELPGGDEVLQSTAGDPLAMQGEIDRLTGRMFRSSLVCRADAPVVAGFSGRVVLDFSLRRGVSPPADAAWVARAMDGVLARLGPGAVPFELLARELPGVASSELARVILEGIGRGWVRARVGDVVFDPVPPAVPVLDAFRLLCAREKLPVVDAWLVPCSFPHSHYEVLARMDGGLDAAGLERLARERCPELQFWPWLKHLAMRGLFG